MDNRWNVKKLTFADGSYTVATFDRHFGKNSSKVKTKNISKTSACNEMSHFPSNNDTEQDNRSFNESIRRTRDKVEILARANQWQYFVTLTLNDKFVNASDYHSSSKAFIKWFDSLRKRYPEVKYLAVLERGSSDNGTHRWHLHALLSDAPLRLEDSGKRTAHRQIVYNMPLEYKLGFTTVTIVRSSARSASYLSKYIGKSLVDVPAGKKRYWASRNLITEEDVTEHYDFDKEQLNELENQLEETCDTKSKSYIPDIGITVKYYRFFAQSDTSPSCPT